MINNRFTFTRVSGNAKTGPIPVTMTDRSSCPDNCGLKESGCYAESGNVRIHWNRVQDKGLDADSFLAHVRTINEGQLWRMNVAGDLPASLTDSATIHAGFLQELIRANKGRQGFTYTHHRIIGHARNQKVIREANENGFTVNLSADNLDQADAYHALNIGPVVCIMPEDCKKVEKTPSGNAVVQCPATYMDGVQCANCGICQVSTRKAIIGFPVHGTSKRKAHRVFMMRVEGGK